MGRKSSSKEQRASSGAAPSPNTAQKRGGLPWMMLGIAALIVVGAGLYAAKGRSGAASTADASSTAAAQTQAGDKESKTPDPNEVAKNEAFARAMTALGPHKQASYPPVPYQSFAPPRPYQTVNAAFQFAADHPEVLSYIPCFCGCQQGGHRGNEDCFVKSRARNGDVTEFEPHGVECAVCIDVATRARQMYTSGASIDQIRAAVEKEFKATYPSMTPTPEPPQVSH